MNSDIQLEAYLQELTQRRLSSQLKLVAAWDGLSLETQIKILSTNAHIPDEVLSKGLDSPNDYVRYLCANRFFCWSDVEQQSELYKQRIEKISNDKSILVKFTHCPSKKVHVREKNKDGHNSLVLKPENFFAMAYEEQYLYFSELMVGDGEDISNILEWGFNNGIEQEHIANLVAELEHNFNEYKSDKYISDDGWLEFLNAKGLEALWQLVPKLGESKPARYLVWSLPTSGIMFDNKIIKNVMKSSPKKLKVEFKDRKTPYKREKIKFFALMSLFIFGITRSFLDIHGWLTLASITIPSIFWVKNIITQSLNNKIDEIIEKLSN